ncbi:MAG TPA: hypothetical protein VMT54_07430 [Candidatus Cybelea sp.]|nr:hypothetical protein [Candidatus Cybelea sp.]
MFGLIVLVLQCVALFLSLSVLIDVRRHLKGMHIILSQQHQRQNPEDAGSAEWLQKP